MLTFRRFWVKEPLPSETKSRQCVTSIVERAYTYETPIQEHVFSDPCRGIPYFHPTEYLALYWRTVWLNRVAAFSVVVVPP